jgi:hypothetical protein
MVLVRVARFFFVQQIIEMKLSGNPGSCARLHNVCRDPQSSIFCTQKIIPFVMQTVETAFVADFSLFFLGQIP